MAPITSPMTFYEERLSADKRTLREQLSRLAKAVDTGLSHSVRALEQSDTELAYQTILRDGPINRLTEEIESDCHRFLAKHLPSGGHLRFVSSVMRIAVLLERMGDYAVTISRQAAHLTHPVSGAFGREVSAMAADALQMFRQSMEAFLSDDESLARGTMGYAEHVDRDFVNALALLEEQDPERIPVQDLFARLVIIRQLERVSDQAKNLCEETVFAITGQTKQRKAVPVLVVDARDDGPTHLAAAIAQRLHAGKVAISTAGVTPASELRPAVRSFLEERGLDSESYGPTPLAEVADRLGSFKVIVGLGTSPEQLVGEIPFESVAVTWDPGQSGDSLEELYRYVSTELSDLVTLLRG